jgi:hypothetical protein
MNVVVIVVAIVVYCTLRAANKIFQRLTGGL